MKIDFYTQIHKALRRWLFNISTQIATLDFTDDEKCQQLHQNMEKLFALLAVHAHHEEECFHPLIQKVINASSINRLNSEHSEQEQRITDIKAIINTFLITQSKELREQYTLLLYKKFNRFIAEYLQHLDEEETIMPLLQDRCSPEELLECLQKLFSQLSIKETIDSMHYMLPALNPSEQYNMLRGLTQNTNEENRQIIYLTAQKSLTKEDWIKLKNSL